MEHHRIVVATCPRASERAVALEALAADDAPAPSSLVIRVAIGSMLLIAMVLATEFLMLRWLD